MRKKYRIDTVLRTQLNRRQQRNKQICSRPDRYPKPQISSSRRRCQKKNIIIRCQNLWNLEWHSIINHISRGTKNAVDELHFNRKDNVIFTKLK